MFLCSSHLQCPAFQGISFRDGTGRDFCKIPGSRDFPGRDLPHIFIPGFFGNCSGFFGIFLFDAIDDQFKHFSQAGKPNKHFFHQKNTHSNSFQRKWNHFGGTSWVNVVDENWCFTFIKTVISWPAFCQVRSFFSTVVSIQTKCFHFCFPQHDQHQDDHPQGD